jgi:thioredoxin 1
MNMALIVTQENYQTELLKSAKPVVLDVYASWCGPCQQMAPIFDELEKELSTLYKFAKLNVDDARDVSIQFGVTSVPTFIFMKGGKVVGKETGFMNKDALREKISKFLG